MQRAQKITLPLPLPLTLTLILTLKWCFTCLMSKETFRLNLEPSEISSEYKCWIYPKTNSPVLPLTSFFLWHIYTFHMKEKRREFIIYALPYPTSRVEWLVCHMCMFLTLCVLNPSGPIPVELGQLRTLEKLDLGFNKLTGTTPPSFYPGLLFHMKEETCFPYAHAFQSTWVWCTLWLRFCMPQVPSQLNWATWRICKNCL